MSPKSSVRSIDLMECFCDTVWVCPADVQPIYVHHFVQWTHKPFEPAIEDGDFIGRGVDDNKGNLLIAVQLSTGAPSPLYIAVMLVSLTTYY